jgi:ribosomal protein S25
MSVLKELHAVEEQVIARLRELEPMVAEYEELRRAAERLGLTYEPGGMSEPAPQPKDLPAASRANNAGRRAGASKPTAPSRSARGGRRSRRRSPVSSAERAAQVLEQVRANPGTTVPEIGKRLQIDYTGLYRVVRELEHEGALRKSGRKLEIA